MKTALDVEAGALFTPYGFWSIAAKHTRPGGDVDVILTRRQKGAPGASLFAFRRDEGEWIQLAGAWTDLDAAVEEAARTTARQVFAARYLIPLLDAAAEMPDIPGAEPEWLTVREAAELVGASKDAIRYRIKHDLVEHRKDGHRFVVTKASLLAQFPAAGGAE